MRVRRSRLAADFVQIPNGTVRDSRLSYMARGVLAELLSRPDGWEATADDLWRVSAEARDTKGEGRRAFRAAFAELKEYGYIVPERERLPGGRHGTVLVVYDRPGHTDVPHAGTPEPQPDVPHDGTSVRPGETHISAGHTDVPHAGMPGHAADVPHAGTPEPPAETGVSPGRTDVPPTDVPHGGTSNRRRSTNTGEKTSSPASGDAGHGSLNGDLLFDDIVDAETVDDTEAEEQAPITAQTIVGEWLERTPKRPPGTVIGQMAKQIRVLLDEDHIDPNDIRSGIARWMTKGLHPSTLPSVVNEVMNAAPARQPASASASYGQQPDGDLFDRALARAAARRAAQEGPTS